MSAPIKTEKQLIIEAIKLIKQAEKLLLKTSMGKPRCELVDARIFIEQFKGEL